MTGPMVIEKTKSFWCTFSEGSNTKLHVIT